MGGKLSRSIVGRCCGSCEGGTDIESDNPVFGVALIKAQRSEKYPKIPNIVVECIDFIESANNIEKKGIYRISGQKTKIDHLKHIIHVYGNYGEIQYEQLITVTSVLKQYFSELKSDIIPCDDLATLFDGDTDFDSKETRNKIREYLRTLRPPEHYETLKYLMKHLHNVSEHSEKNSMNPFNLSVIWGACLFLSQIQNSPKTNILFYNRIVQTLIEHYAELFE